MTCFIDLRKMIITAVVVGCMMGIGQVSANDTSTQTSQHKISYKLGYAKFAKGTCTDYAASRRKDLFPSRNGNDRRFGGNAISWLSHARQSGIPTGKKPSIGSIAVFGAGRGAGSSYGHVAIVEKIIDHDTIVVSDMNYAGRNKITTRTISSTLALGYIYKLPTDDNETSEVKKTIPIQLSLGDNKEHDTIGSVQPIDGAGISLPPKTIVYATPITSSPQKNQSSDAIVRDMIIVADNRYIMKHLSQHINTTVTIGQERMYHTS